jgi:hypothetical protein
MTCADSLDLTSTSATAEYDDLCRQVDALGFLVDAMWRDALESGDFGAVDRCAAAGQALHRAALALRSGACLGT